MYEAFAPPSHESHPQLPASAQTAAHAPCPARAAPMPAAAVMHSLMLLAGMEADATVVAPASLVCRTVTCKKVAMTRTMASNAVHRGIRGRDPTSPCISTADVSMFPPVLPGAFYVQC